MSDNMDYYSVKIVKIVFESSWFTTWTSVWQDLFDQYCCTVKRYNRVSRQFMHNKPGSTFLFLFYSSIKINIINQSLNIKTFLIIVIIVRIFIYFVIIIEFEY